MDTNNNSSSAMDLPMHNDQQQPMQEDQQPEQQAIKSDTLDQNPDRIELYVRYDASDMLRDESGTQTPIEDEPSQGTGEGSTTTETTTTQITAANATDSTQEQDTGTNNKSSDDDARTSKTKVVCVKESEEENSESIEIELEEDNSLLLTSLTSLFPDATGLKFRHPEANSLRGVKLVDGKFAEPIDGWSSVKNYICVFNRGTKRKTEDEDEVSKKSRVDPDKPGPGEASDLIVLGLPWTTTEETMRSYFEQYGEVTLVQVKTDSRTGKSRGFGFVRFARPSIQNTLLSMRHFIDGRWCDVRNPTGKVDAETAKVARVSRKVFVGRLPENITTEDLRSHFSEFGTLTDVFIPKPFRNFAFVTFGTSEMAEAMYKQKREHRINGSPITISEALPKNNASGNYGGGGGFNSGPQPPAGGYGVGYGGNANNNIHPFNNSYGASQAPYHHHGKNNVAGSLGGGAYGGRKMHQQSTYYQTPPYGSSGPSSGADPASGYANHTEYGSFGTAAAGYNQASAGVNGGQYYKMQQQQQPVITSNQNHSTYTNPSSYSNHGGANFSRGSYGSVWK